MLMINLNLKILLLESLTVGVTLFYPQAANVPLQYPSLVSHRLSQHMDHPVYTFVVPPEDKGANQQLATHVRIFTYS